VAPLRLLPQPEARWARLERYAACRARPFRLLALPDDVLAMLCREHLSSDDVFALATAFVGRVPTVHEARDVPRPLRSVWMLRRVVADAEAYLYALGELCFFHARDGAAVVAFFDWTPFSSAPGQPVAQYEWEIAYGRAPRASVHLCQQAIHECLYRCFQRRSSDAYLSIYTLIRWHGRSMLNPRPLQQTWVRMLPTSAAHLALGPQNACASEHTST
jgi:hypothetical protein